MIALPFLTPRPTGNGKIAQELRQLRDVVKQLTPARSPGTTLHRTTMGTIRRGNPRTASGGGGQAVWL